MSCITILILNKSWRWICVTDLQLQTSKSSTSALFPKSQIDSVRKRPRRIKMQVYADASASASVNNDALDIRQSIYISTMNTNA